MAALPAGATATSLWRLALDHVERLRPLPASQLASAMVELRAHAPDLHERVCQLLQATDEAGDDLLPGLLARQAGQALAGWDLADPAPDLAGQRFGPYQFDQLIGEGGMGQVWLARRVDGHYSGQVAVKLLHHRASPAAAERFKREGRLLGRLQHPHIARLLDAGTLASGQRVLVLEHVAGQRIDQHADAQGLDVHARVALVRQVCDAVAHAHANLVVHRDLKPSNVLVAPGQGVKLLDFGIAKLIEDDGSGDGTELTRHGGRAMTLRYAAPEQVSGESVSTATDVYALGVMLYELLCGQRPLGHDGQSTAQLARVISEQDPPPMASHDLAEAARSRATTPARLRALLRGDLQTIVAKALRKSPADRYASVTALADDLQRWAAHEPVRARRDSLGYRARRFVRRHRAAVAGASLALLALAAGLLLALWQAQRAQRESQRAQAVQQFLVQLFRSGDLVTQGGQGVPARDLLQRGAADLDRADLPADTRDALYEVLGAIYERSTEYQQSLPLRRQRLQHALAHWGQGSPQAVHALAELTSALRSAKLYAEAEPLLRQQIDQAAARGDPALLARRNLAGVLSHLGRAEESQRQFDDFFARAAMAEPQGDAARFQHLWLRLDALHEAGKSQAAVDLALRHEDWLRQPPAGKQSLAITARLNLQDLLLARGQLADAAARMPDLRRVVASLFPGASLMRGWVHELGADLAQAQGDLPAALADARSAHRLKIEVLGPTSPDVLHAELRLSRLALQAGDVAGARHWVDAAARRLQDPAQGISQASRPRAVQWQALRVAVAECRTDAARAAWPQGQPATPAAQAAQLELQAALALCEGDAPGAAVQFAQAAARVDPAAAQEPLARALLGLHAVRARLLAGDAAAARALLHGIEMPALDGRVPQHPAWAYRDRLLAALSSPAGEPVPRATTLLALR